MKLHILFGTETGNAEMVADDLAEAAGREFEVSVQDMAQLDVSELIEPDGLYLIVCSTYGDGELPASAQPFAQNLSEQQPNLSGLRFAIFGLGDSFYATYNQGSALIAAQLTELGASQVGERGLHDATSGELPGEVAQDWLKTLLTQL
ncbi:nitric oxide synthase [Ventosimonas gracilis]|uniref:Nitric oxide synthase n=1 Tax=Ventosimonas gracilis TaxID=1680762 RepID=A0A139SRM8_9GAMM|nr:flavodoxin domain-containing protein [Ventosimonas gracilis]KXU37164.1 nitric oxide synthase [Ventosimonas gracilis]